MENPERRRKQRIRCILGIGKINGEPCPNTYLTDISSIGAQMETGNSLAVGDPVEFLFSPAGGNCEEKGPCCIVGRVVWIKELEMDARRFRIGLSFSTPMREATEILARFRYQLV